MAVATQAKAAAFALSLTAIAAVLYVVNSIVRQADALRLTCRDAMSVDELASALNVGDVIYWCAKKARPITHIVCSFTGTCFYHVGIIVMHEGVKKVLHYVNPSYNYFFQGRPICAVQQHGPGLNPCVSELAPLLLRYAQIDSYALVAQYSGDMTSEDMLALATRISCGKHYDQQFYISYFAHRYSRMMDTLHCNTFVALLLEAMAEIPPSPHPIRDYIPGRLWRYMLAASRNYSKRATYCVRLAPPPPHNIRASSDVGLGG